MSKKCSPLCMVAMILLVIGGLNWGLIAFFGFDLVQFLMVDTIGSMVAAQVTYGIVGLAAVYVVVKKVVCAIQGGCHKGSCDTKKK
jgi:hypothetical protein